MWAAAGSDIDHSISRLFDLRQEFFNIAGSCVGLPVSGSRACKCKIDAPASAAPSAALTISPGVMGRYGDMLGV